MAILIVTGVAFVGGGTLAARYASKALSGRLGWDDLADKYPVQAQHLGDWKVRQSCYINDIFFPDCLDLGEDEKTLYFAFRFPLDTFPRVQIPWEAIPEAIVRGKTIEMKIERVKLRIRKSSFGPIALGHLLKE